MPGYVIADVTVTDPETYAGYRALTPSTMPSTGASSCAAASTR